MEDYDPKEIEPKWRERWLEERRYRFEGGEDRPAFVIDTPPPYPTGELHMGHVLNWTYMDVVARYKRMRGYDVFFPQGWDCHGLPTEVKVEEIHGITKRDVPREEFRKLCEELTLENIRKMREQLTQLGCSIDWWTNCIDYENEELEELGSYVTMDPDYIRRSQYGFLELLEKGYAYREEHPVNWCPRCETAIAFAEVEYVTRETYLNYIEFPVADGGGSVTIATTRPELLPACVAVTVHPDDDRYSDLVGKKLVVPLHDRFGDRGTPWEVPVIADEEVDPEFGTGIVMICTFGDKQDVAWVKRHDLPIVRAIDDRGRMTEVAGEFAGMEVEKARAAIVEALKEEGYLTKREKITQNVGVCWRCKTPIEILVKKQWFVKVRELAEDVKKAARNMVWIPEHMRKRLEEWTESMDWDWCISRQRVFATPIPVWYCKECGEVIPAKEDQLPVDPTRDDPPVDECPRCGCPEFEPETDVMDTWMDSSITPLVITGWPDEEPDLPVDLRPQGHDIIRTWLYYTTVRTLVHADSEPFKEILINGMVFGEDGHKMSKSRGNVVEPTEVIDEYGADALRYWAVSSGAPGSDVQYMTKTIKRGYRLAKKVWNVCRLAKDHIDDAPSVGEVEGDLTPADRWILSKFHRLVDEVTEHLDSGYRFNDAIKAIEEFAWEELADDYLEMAKLRLYRPEELGEGSREATRAVLCHVLDGLLRLLAPFMPFVTEELYHRLFDGSVHDREWPEASERWIDEEAEEVGEILREIVTEVRKAKTDAGLRMGAEFEGLTVHVQDEKLAENLERAVPDLKSATRAVEVEVKVGEPELERVPVKVEPRMDVIGPKYRELTRDIIEYVENNPDEVASAIKESGKVKLEIDGEEVVLDEECVDVEWELRVKGGEGKAVEIRPGVVVEIRGLSAP
ncbi:valine--tRNA ligase [Methanopyrus sp.]